MATRTQQEEENWDDDFEFGSSAGSPVMGTRGDTTPPNLSPRAIARRALGQESNRSGLRTPPNSKGRWSSGSIENWDDEDETINFKALASGLSQRPVTPKAQSKPQNRTPTRVQKISDDSGHFWDDEDDIDLARSARVVPAHPSASFTPPTSNTTNGINNKSSDTSRANRAQMPQQNIFSPDPSTFPSTLRKPEPNGSVTDTNTSATDIMDSSDSSVLQQSDTSASVSTSQSSSFFGRLGRRLSKAGSGATSRNATLSPSATEDMSNSSFPSAIFSPPSSSNSLMPSSTDNSYTAGSSPSKSKTGFSFGAGMLKRSGSLSKSSKKANGGTEASGYGPAIGLGVHLPNSGTGGPNGAAHTAPAVFNARRYTERIIGPSYPSSAQYAPPVHGHSHSIAGFPKSMAPAWGAPPSPTRHGKAKQIGSSDGVEMLTSLSPRKKLQASGAQPTSPIEASKPTHQSSASVSGTFFSSIRRKSNPLQAASKVPNSAMTGAPPPASTLAFSRNGLPSMKSAAALDEPTRQDDKREEQLLSIAQSSVQPQTQPQRQRRTHRRNVSTGAMITSVIDEVSSDGTVNNKLSAGAMRERQPPLKSGLNQSTTASEIRRAGTSTPPSRLSTSSTGSSPPPVSPIEFARASEDSGSIGRSSDRAFVLPPSMSIRSPALPTSGIRTDAGRNGRHSSDWSPSSSSGDGTGASGLLPPIELCPPSPLEAQLSKPSKLLTMDRKREALMQVGEADEDMTPVAAPRRRVHHLQIGNGTIVPVASLPRGSQLDTPKAEVSHAGGLTASISAPVSIASTGSNATLGPKSSGVHTNKHFDCVNTNGRTSPGISASLGRLAGASAAGGIGDQTPVVTGSGLTRRNSLSGGVISATLSTTGSMGGGLRIPARISAKQDALKRDLSAVREFALSIDELKRLQFSYETVLFDIKRLCTSGPGPRQTTPFTDQQPKQWYKIRTAGHVPQFHIPRTSVPDAETHSLPSTPLSPTFDKPKDERRRHIIHVPDRPPEEPVDEASFIPAEQKELTAASLAELDMHYAIWWECADLLVELGGAAPPVVAGTAIKSPTLPALRKPGFSVFDEQSTPRAKGRHATLPKRESRPNGSIGDLTSPDLNTPSSRRRDSTGQQDLNARQVQLLKGMLNTPNPNDLSSSVDFGSLYGSQLQALSPVISNPASTVRNPAGVTTGDEGVVGGAEPQGMTEKERKRNRRISLGLAGKLGVHQILAGLKWTKEKAKQRYKQPAPTPDTNSRSSVDFAAADSRTSIDQSQATPLPVEPVTRYESDAGQSRDNLNATSPAQQGAQPSPYKRNRRRSLASIFKFGNSSTTQTEDRSISRSRSRVDLTSPLGYVSNTGSHHTSSRADDSTGPDADSDWDQMNSPSDIPSRYASSHKARLSAQDLSAPNALSRGRTAPIGVPITNGSRRGSATGSRNASASRNVYSSASASAASLVGSSVYGSSASQASFHESFGGRSANEKIEEDRRRLKKPPSKQPRRPPSAGGRKSGPSSSQGSSPCLVPSTTPPALVSPIVDRPYYSTRSASHHSPKLPEQPSNPYYSSTRSAPMHGTSTSSATDLSQPRLALTPENIMPLLVYAREVKLKLADCLVELKSLESDLLMSKVGGHDLDSDGPVEFIPGEGE